MWSEKMINLTFRRMEKAEFTKRAKIRYERTTPWEIPEEREKPPE